MIIKYILPIIALIIVITIHELGHLITAKIFRVKVEVFSIGIGKKLFKYDFRGTQYTISLLPLGGYCKLKGGDIQNPLKDSDSIDMAHPLKKVLIFFAGPFFNLLLTFFLLTTILILPVHQKLPSTVIPVTGKSLPAETSGMIKGDRIVSIDGVEIFDFNEISKNIDHDKLNIIIDRNGKLSEIIINPKRIDGRPFIGVYPYIPLTVLKDSKDILKKGDKIVKINNNEVDNYLSLIKVTNGKNEFEISYIRDNVEYKIIYGLKSFNSLVFTENYSHSILQSIIIGAINTIEMLNNITFLFIDLFKNGEVTKNISSPLRLIYEVGNSIDGIYTYNNLLITIQSFLTIMASISLTLGFINLLPIPVLDGGQILLNTISALKGSPINKSFIYGYQTAGLIIILLLFTLGISNDIFFFGDL